MFQYLINTTSFFLLLYYIFSSQYKKIGGGVSSQQITNALLQKGALILQGGMVYKGIRARGKLNKCYKIDADVLLK